MLVISMKVSCLDKPIAVPYRQVPYDRPWARASEMVDVDEPPTYATACDNSIFSPIKIDIEHVRSINGML